MQGHASESRIKPFGVTGAISRSSHVFIDRPEATELINELLRGHHCHLRAGRQVGKTSLILDCKRKLRDMGYIGLEQALYTHATEHRTAYGAVHAMAIELWKDFTDQTGKTLPALTPSSERSGDVLPMLFDLMVASLGEGQRVFVLLDEFDSLLNYSPDEIASVFFHLRDWAQTDAATRVTLLISSVRTPDEFVNEFPTAGITPNFLLGIHLPLFRNDDETRQQIADQGFEIQTSELLTLISDVLEHTGGQPHLSCVLLDLLQQSRNRKETFSKIRRDLDSGDGYYSRVASHLGGFRQQILDSTGQSVALLETYRKVRSEHFVQPEAVGIYGTYLENLGLIRQSGGKLVVTNPLYERWLDNGWIAEVQDAVIRQDRVRAAQQKQVTTESGSNAARKRIALVLTGGTIGMITPGGRSTFHGAEQKLREVVKDELSAGAEVDLVPFRQLDGINVTPRDWIDIADWIHEYRPKYDGVVVAHGTDTLAFTAAALAFIFGPGLNFPIVFTGAQTTVDILYGDARDNLIRACMVTAHPDSLREVQVVFGDSVFRAVCVEKGDDRLFDGFRSPGWPELARITEQLLINRYALVNRSTVPHDTYSKAIAANIIPILLVPGLRPDYFMQMFERAIDDGRKPDGIIIHTPGVGNIPSLGDNNFRPLLSATIDWGIPVLVTSQVPINPYTQPQYEMARAVTEFNAILAGNMTFAAAFAKFAWVIGHVNEETLGTADTSRRHERIATLMGQNYVGEQG